MGTAAFPTKGVTCFQVKRKCDEKKGLKQSRRLEYGVSGMVCGDELKGSRRGI